MSTQLLSPTSKIMNPAYESQPMKASSKEQQILTYQKLKLAEIGLELKRIREEQDISLHKIKQITLISERHLKAIEAGDISSLPESVYIQSFIRKYARVMGIENIAEQFPLISTSLKTSWLKSSELRPFHLYLIYIVLISASVGALSNLFSPASNYFISESETQLSDAARLKPLTKPKTIAIPAQPQSINVKPAPIKPVNVGIVMKGESWMRVEVDGEVKFEGILTEGVNKAWVADKNIVVRAGNAAAILLEFNQYPPQALGRAGEVVQKTYNSTYKPKALTSLYQTAQSQIC